MSALLWWMLFVVGGGGTGPAIVDGGPPTGSLDKEVIRGVILGNVKDVKRCYEAELEHKPDLFGRIMVKFTIATSGQVTASAVQETSVHDGQVEACTVAAVRRWRFPPPMGGGIVIVSYPFILIPAESIALSFKPAAGDGPVDIKVLELDTMVHRSTNAAGIPSNGLIVVTGRGLVLIDTAWTETQTEAILKWGEARLGRPWIGAVITHDHPDRDGGIGALLRRHIPVAALDLTVAKLRRRGVQGVATLFTAQAGAWSDPRGFEAFYPGPGHTSDNIVVRFPKIVFGGCLIKSLEATDLGFTADADLARWPESVRRVAARYPKLPVVPGHGEVDPTAGAFQHTLDLLAAARKK